jgi:hypothetical protein
VFFGPYPLRFSSFCLVVVFVGAVCARRQLSKFAKLEEQQHGLLWLLFLFLGAFLKEEDTCDFGVSSSK